MFKCRLPDRKTSILGTLYFCLGVQSSIYEFALRMDMANYNVSISSISWWSFGIFFIWFVKFIPALASDYYGVNGYHRKPPMIVGNIIAALCMLIMSNEKLSLPSFGGFLFLYNAFICFADVNYDACIVKATRDEDSENGERGSTQTSMTVFRESGSALGDCLGPLLWEKFGSTGVYQGVAITCLKAFVLSMLYPETPDFPKAPVVIDAGTAEQHESIDIPRITYQNAQPSMRSLIRSVWKTLSHSVLRRIFLFSLIASLFPSAGLAMFYYLTGPMQFTPKQMSALGFISAIARVVGTLVYRCVRNMSMRRIYNIVGALSVVVSVVPMFIVYRVPFNTVSPINNGTSAWNETDANFTVPTSDWNDTSLDSNSTGPVTITLAKALGLDEFVFAVSDDTFDSILGTLRMMPVLTVVAIVCEKSVEAGAYATILSSFNMFNGVRRLTDGLFMSALGIDHGNFSNLWILVLVCMGSDILTLLASFCIIPNVRLTDIKTYDDDGNAMDGIHDAETELRNIETSSQANQIAVQHKRGSQVQYDPSLAFEI